MGIRVRLCSDWCLREADDSSDYPQTSVSCIVRTQYPYFAQRYAGITGFGPVVGSVSILKFTVSSQLLPAVCRWSLHRLRCGRWRADRLRHCAFIRGKVIVGKGAVVGNSTELKNVILFDGVQVPHYNYVGDSILGYKAHMGAGSITSNVRSDKALVKVHAEDGDIETGLKKFGAMIGDCVEVGCGSVLNPGTVIGKNSSVYPLSSVRTAVDADSIYKQQGEVAKRQ